MHEVCIYSVLLQPTGASLPACLPSPCDCAMLQVGALCRLETDIQTLEQHLESMRAAYQLNQEKLDYNYRVLLERDAENQATITQQKRKVSKQRDLLSTLMVPLSPPCTVHLSLSVSCLSVCLAVCCLSVGCLSVWLSVCLPVCLYICQSCNLKLKPSIGSGNPKSLQTSAVAYILHHFSISRVWWWDDVIELSVSHPAQEASITVTTVHVSLRKPAAAVLLP